MNEKKKLLVNVVQKDGKTKGNSEQLYKQVTRTHSF